MRNIKVSEILTYIEESKQDTVMLLNADFSAEEKFLIIKFARIHKKEARFVTMREFIFNEDENILKIK
jgi:hypothetical protein